MKLLGIGDNTVDMYVDRGLEFPGGNAVNVAVFAKRLGFEGSYLGCIGNDAHGRQLMDALAAEGIDTSHVRRLPEPNSWTRIRHEGNDRVFDGSHRITLTKYNLVLEDFNYIAEHRHCHTSIYSGLENDLAAISNAANCLSFDFSEEYTDAYIADIAPHIDIAFLSGAERTISECSRLSEILYSFGCRTTVITRGAEGAMGIHNGAVHHSKPARGEVVDTLGAGDGFIAGFLVAYHTGLSFDASLALGATNAAIACSEEGAFGYAAPIETIKTSA